jgi:ABC-type multidrug transport system ATPase subunit
MEAMLRLPKSVSEDAKRELVEELISRLSLTACADTVVGDKKTRGLSGGIRSSLASPLLR